MGQDRPSGFVSALILLVVSQGSERMIDVMVVLTARSGSAMPDLRALLQSHSRLSRGEPGCLRFESYESTSVPNTFVLIERWESQAALDVHRTAEGFTTIYAPKVLPLVDRAAYVCRPLE